MTDVRSLLRDERASRRIDHPNASYTSTGTLQCSVCRIPVKADSNEWSKHLRSTQHAMRAERQRLAEGQSRIGGEGEGPIERRSSSSTKKRKADDAEDDARKKTRPLESAQSGALKEAKSESQYGDESVKIFSLNMGSAKTASPLADTNAQTVDEDEWAAFEREVATPPPEQIPKPPGMSTQAVISAAPVSAAELAAQEKQKERESGKERREAEVEGEKEDAARAIEEEFDEMEGLEERLRKLKEKREALRLASAMDDGDSEAGNAEKGATGGGQGRDEDHGDESEEDDDGYGSEGWGLGW